MRKFKKRKKTGMVSLKVVEADNPIFDLNGSESLKEQIPLINNRMDNNN